MKLLCSILVLTFLQYQLISQVVSTGPAEAPPSFDPYFTETTDTVATFGPRTITRAILQDKRGNYWFATWQGIMRFDGKVFTNYTLKENLVHFHVFSVFEDSGGNLWFGTVRGGVYRYDGKDFRLFTTKEGLAGNSASSITEDKQGNLWFATDGGVSRYDGSTFTNFTTGDGLSTNSVNSILQDMNGRMWFACIQGGINCFDGKTITAVTDSAGQPFRDVLALLQDTSGRIWFTGRAGLYRVESAAQAGAGITTKVTRVLDKAVLYAMQDRKGNFWLSVSESKQSPANRSTLYYHVLQRYDGRQFTRIVEKSQPGDQQVFGITEDKSGNIWFGTMKGAGRIGAAHLSHPCLLSNCRHELPMDSARTQHEQEMAKVITYFR
jgi:ligand-binding sensor domain-containing protein